MSRFPAAAAAARCLRSKEEQAQAILAAKEAVVPGRREAVAWLAAHLAPTGAGKFKGGGGGGKEAGGEAGGNEADGTEGSLLGDDAKLLEAFERAAEAAEAVAVAAGKQGAPMPPKLQRVRRRG